MNLDYAIFRSEPIYTLSDLAQIGSHNKREKQAYNSNPDIKLELSQDNIELVPLSEKYVKGFYNLTKDYKKEHEERMKTEREDRKKTFKEMVDKSRSVVADEMLFTATHTFFDNMNKEDIKKWADTCMEFVYEDLGYTKKQVLHATVHMDEKTPHLHCVVVPLVKKYDKRTKTERYTISKKQYIKDKIHLSELQDKYHERLISKGYDLERGIKGSSVEHENTKELKRRTRKLENTLDLINGNLDNAIGKLNDKMKTTKNIPFDKKHILMEKETFDKMNKVVKETQKALSVTPKINQLFNEVNDFTKSHKALQYENKSMEKEIRNLKIKNRALDEENRKLKDYLKAILERIKEFFRELLHIDNEKTKEQATTEIKVLYDYETFDMLDVKDIAKGTTKEDELFDYAGVPDYYKKEKSSDNEKDDFNISM